MHISDLQLKAQLCISDSWLIFDNVFFKFDFQQNSSKAGNIFSDCLILMVPVADSILTE